MRNGYGFRECLLIGLAVSLIAVKGLSAAEPTLRTAWTKSRIAGTPEPPAPYRLESPFQKLRFERPTSVEELPGSNRLLIT